MASALKIPIYLDSIGTILVGALAFAGMFTVLALLTELLFEGVARVTPGVLSFGGAAFIGYVGVASLLRSEPRAPEE